MTRRARSFPVRPANRRRSYARGWLLAGAVAAAAAGTSVFIFSRLFESDEPRTGDAGPVHVHALGLNPADRSLFIATHTGLFRLAEGEERPERVGDRRQDTMGFTVAGRDHFLGSGHPDLRDDLPPLLGLIESRDAGRTWTPISLLGRSDFHALRLRAGRVVGYDATSGQVMISDDQGRSWLSRPAPEPLLDLVIHPGSAERLLAAGQSRLFVSSDAGRTWTERQRGTGLLAWPRRDALYLLDGAGRLWLSRNGGTRWQARGQIGDRPAALLAVSATVLYAAEHGGEITLSRDGGVTWSTRSTP